MASFLYETFISATMIKIVHVGGAKGVGKTTILTRFNGFYSPECIVRVVTVSDLLKCFGKSKFGLEWINLNEAQRTTSRKLVIGYIKSLKSDVVLLDSHYVDMKDGEIKEIIPPELKSLIDAHILIGSSPAEILRRRLNDNLRERACNLDQIAQEIEAEEKTATTIANHFRKPIYFIRNDEINSALLELSKVMQECLHEIKSNK